MGNFYNIKIWLEDRESSLLENHDFTEEVWESEIDEDKKWILIDLCSKGFLCKEYFKEKDESYYTHAGGYLQHFDKQKV